ncbi:MAG: spore cortex biosynthesis protein YabQ [Clostridia bacterium]|nr:spore cortex biosynthesis protein YabQ [Clostridia bacterium]
MQYLPTTEFQAVTFMYSAGLGFTLGIIYDFFRMLFYLLTGSDKKFLMARDIIFLCVCFPATFIFLLVMCNGELLLYIFVGEAVGMWIYFYSVGSFLLLPVKRIIKSVRRHFIVFYSFMSGIKTAFVCILKKLSKNLQNHTKFLQKHLQIRHHMVYNCCVQLCLNRILKNRGD